MKPKNIFRALIIISFKLGLGLVSAYVGLFISLLIFLVFYSIFPSSPNKDKAIKTTGVISNYYLPKSFKLVYSRKKWVSSSNNICFIFSYPKGYYSIYNDRYNYINQNKNHGNKEFLFEFNSEISKKEGCSKFIKKLNNKDATLFIEYDYHYEYGRGSKIFINQQNNLIMFEGYYYD